MRVIFNPKLNTMWLWPIANELMFGWRLKGFSGEVSNQSDYVFLLLHRGRVQFTWAVAAGWGHIPSPTSHPVLVPKLKDSFAWAFGLFCFLQCSSNLRSSFQRVALKSTFKHTRSEQVFFPLSLCYVNGTNLRFVCFKLHSSCASTLRSVKLWTGAFEADALCSHWGQAQVNLAACELQGIVVVFPTEGHWKSHMCYSGHKSFDELRTSRSKM